MSPPTPIDPPQSVNLDFQTGIAKDTLLFGQIRWVDWSNTPIDIPPAVDPAPLLSYADDRISYTPWRRSQVQRQLVWRDHRWAMKMRQGGLFAASVADRWLQVASAWA